MIQWLEDQKKQFDDFALGYFSEKKSVIQDVSPLMDAIEYSFFNGAKRFRPLLCYAVGKALGVSLEKLHGFALSVECIHTYSLLHDDLPCMDNDAFRRGQPSTHKKFSENLALLAGDSLLTEAFAIVPQYYPHQCDKLVELLTKASGFHGMIRGQTLDLGHGKPVKTLEDLIKLHRLKTGELIALCFQGTALLAQTHKNPHFSARSHGSDSVDPKNNSMERQTPKQSPAIGDPDSVDPKKDSGKNPLAGDEFRKLGLKLGLAFQIKDDLLDFEDKDSISFVSFLGIDESNQYFYCLNREIGQTLKTLGLEGSALEALMDYNEKRKK